MSKIGLGRRLSCVLVLFALMAYSLRSHAISGNEEVALAGSGRFDELASQLEADAAVKPLRTADLHALCFAYSKLKTYTKLLSCLDLLEVRARQGDIRTRLFGLDDVTPAIDTMRAEAMIDLADYSAAKNAAKRALAWYSREQSDDKDIEANALAALTIASVFNSERAAAEGHFAALEKIDVSWPRNNAYANAKFYAVARAALALGRYEETVQALSDNKSFALQVFLDNLLSGATFRGASNWVWQQLPRGYMLAKALKELGRRTEAKAAYDRLLAVKEAESNGEIYWLLLYDRGRIAEEENDISMAINLYGRAIDTLEIQRASISTEANKIGFIGNKQEVYERIIHLLMKSGQHRKALEYVERSKSRAFIDMLAGKLNAPDFIRPSRDAGLALNAFLDAEAAAKLQTPTIVASNGEARRSGVTRAADRLRQVSPEAASLVTVDKIPVARIQALLGADETLVQYYLSGDDGIVFVVTRSSLRTFTFPAGGIEDEVKQFRVAVEKREKRALDLSRQLYIRLVGPAAAELKTGNLLIVPYGPLHYLSFAALFDGTKFMVDRFGLRSLPSASALQYITSRPDTGGAMVVFGNPDLGSAEFDLPDAQAEAETVARAFPHSKLLLRKAASETAFAEQAGKYRLVHIASHGEFNAETPLSSALMLAKDGKNDGQLTVAELYAVKLKADLVTLSACETGIGKVASGDDVVGLSRGFLFAGTRSIIASLWKVPDQATSYLMERLYLQLARGNNKRDALRTAQLETKKRYAQPFFWAGFYLIGSER